MSKRRPNLLHGQGVGSGREKIGAVGVDSGREKIGAVGVDSGQLLVCDPGYIDSSWSKKDFHDHTAAMGEFNYAGCCAATLSDQSYGQLVNDIGAEMGVAFASGYGDGVYPVMARRNKEGRIVEVRIKMD